MNANKIPHYLKALVFLVVLASGSGQGFGQEFAAEGFRGIPWKSDLGRRNDMVFHEKSKSTAYFTRRGESLRLGNGDLVNLYYGTYKGQFYLVLAQFQGSNDREKIKYVLFKEFGKPYKPDEDRLDYVWTKGDTTATLMYDNRTKTGTLIYTYDPLDREASQSIPKGKAE
ncbi:MAG: hypothetical protein WC100_02035 [Sterolibacterium sp.]